MIGQDAGARDGLGEAARVPEGVGLALTDRQPPPPHARLTQIGLDQPYAPLTVVARR